jgi:hypothetical protein
LVNLVGWIISDRSSVSGWITSERTSDSQLNYTSDCSLDWTPESTRLFKQRPDVIQPAIRQGIRRTS